MTVFINGTLQVTDILTHAKKGSCAQRVWNNFWCRRVFFRRWSYHKIHWRKHNMCTKAMNKSGGTTTAKIEYASQRSNYSLKIARRRQELPRHLDLRVWLSATITGLPEIPHPSGELLGRIHSGQENHLYPATIKYKKDVRTTHVLRSCIYYYH